MPRTVIVGGSAGGAAAAARLRRLDERAEIIIIEREGYITLEKCGLAYFIGGVVSGENTLEQFTPEGFSSRFKTDVRIFSEVLAINKEQKTVAIKNLKSGDEYTERYDNLIIATGAAPVLPPIHGVELGRVFCLRNLTDALKIKEFIESKKPRSAAIVGGSYIGVEAAENLCAAGLEVTIIEMFDQILPPLDYEMACETHRCLRSNGVSLILGHMVNAISESGGGLVITLDEGKVSADMVILAAGVRPEAQLAKTAGIALSGRGAVIVSEGMLTSEPDIYAVGDVTETTDFVTGQKTIMPMAGIAQRQGRVAADRICGLDSVYTGTQCSAILKIFDMTAAFTGINEKTAKRLGICYEKSFTYSPNYAGFYPGAEGMSVKTIYNAQSGKILGAQIVGGEGVDKRCDIFAAAIRFGASAHDLTNLELCCGPSYSNACDPVNIAGSVIENALAGRVKPFHWHDIGKFSQAALLDVRTADEFNEGNIKGSVNIPLDALRSRLGGLDKSKNIYVISRTGQRGYTACRILAQSGFNAHNLSGGYRLYSLAAGLMPGTDKSSHETSEAPAAHRERISSVISRFLKRN